MSSSAITTFSVAYSTSICVVMLALDVIVWKNASTYPFRRRGVFLLMLSINLTIMYSIIDIFVVLSYATSCIAFYFLFLEQYSALLYPFVLRAYRLSVVHSLTRWRIWYYNQKENNSDSTGQFQPSLGLRFWRFTLTNTGHMVSIFLVFVALAIGTVATLSSTQGEFGFAGSCSPASFRALFIWIILVGVLYSVANFITYLSICGVRGAKTMALETLLVAIFGLSFCIFVVIIHSYNDEAVINETFPIKYFGPSVAAFFCIISVGIACYEVYTEPFLSNQEMKKIGQRSEIEEIISADPDRSDLLKEYLTQELSVENFFWLREFLELRRLFSMKRSDPENATSGLSPSPSSLGTSSVARMTSVDNDETLSPNISHDQDVSESVSILVPKPAFVSPHPRGYATSSSGSRPSSLHRTSSESSLSISGGGSVISRRRKATDLFRRCLNLYHRFVAAESPFELNCPSDYRTRIDRLLARKDQASSTTSDFRSLETPLVAQSSSTRILSSSFASKSPIDISHLDGTEEEIFNAVSFFSILEELYSYVLFSVEVDSLPRFRRDTLYREFRIRTLMTEQLR